MFHSQPKPGEGAMAPQPPAPRPKVRARRGQATDPHSIAERVIPDKFRCFQLKIDAIRLTFARLVAREILVAVFCY